MAEIADIPTQGATASGAKIGAGIGTVTAVLPDFVGRCEGWDLRDGLDDATAEALRAAHDRYPVLLIQDQHLTPEGFLDIARVWGVLEIDHHLPQFQHPERPELIFLTNRDKQDRPDPGAADRGSAWHADSSYKPNPCAHTMLYARELPSRGGGTLYADMARAYETLPPDLKEAIEERRAMHRFGAGPSEGGVIPLTPEQEAANPAVDQPMVRVHPRTGKKCLYVNPLHTYAVVGMPETAGLDLLRRVFDHAAQERFQYHHHWARDQIVVWDQQRTMHRGAGDYAPGEKRLLWRAKMGQAERQ